MENDATGDPDDDNDSTPDTDDPDDDNDGVNDDIDTDVMNNNFVCGDTEDVDGDGTGEGDGCEDCSSGFSNPANDGWDYDGDTFCDRGDPDDDNDGLDGCIEDDGAPPCIFDCAGSFEIDEEEGDMDPNVLCGYIVQWEDSGCLADCSDEDGQNLPIEQYIHTEH
jgi:heat shock protein beta